LLYKDLKGDFENLKFRVTFKGWIIKIAKWTHWINTLYTQNPLQSIDTRTFTAMLPFKIYNMLADKVSTKP